MAKQAAAVEAAAAAANRKRPKVAAAVLAAKIVRKEVKARKAVEAKVKKNITTTAITTVKRKAK